MACLNSIYDYCIYPKLLKILQIQTFHAIGRIKIFIQSERFKRTPNKNLYATNRTKCSSL